MKWLTSLLILVLVVFAPFSVSGNPWVAFGGIHLSLAPDAQQVALSYQGAIGLLSREDNRLDLVTRGPGWDIQPAWNPVSKQLLFIRSVDFRTGSLCSLDLATRKIDEWSIRARGPLAFLPDGQRVVGHFSTSGFPNRLAGLHLPSKQIHPLVGFPAEHASRVNEAFGVNSNGDALVYAIHRDQPGEQTGNRGPQAQLWRYDFVAQRSVSIGEVPSRVHRIAAGSQPGEWLLVSDWGGAHYNVWRATSQNGRLDFERLTAGLADEDWPSAHQSGLLVYTDNSRNSTRIVAHDLRTLLSQDVEISRINHGEPTRRIDLAISAADGAPGVGRISIQRLGGRFYFPLGAMYRLTSGLGHFYGREKELIDLPYGTYRLIAFKGTEYQEVRETFSVDANSPGRVSVRFERWCEPAAEHWYAGENHIHANYGYGAWYSDVRTVADQVEGEGLNVANLVIGNSDGDGLFDRPFFLGRADPRSTHESILFWNEEFRSTIWGHLTIVDLRQLVEPIFTGFAGTTNPWDVPTNAEVARSARHQGASVSYTHPARDANDPYDGAYTAKGLPVDAALEVVDTLDVLGFGYDGSLPLWYRLLNCGFRIPAAAGTDCFLNRVRGFPPGWGRCYVNLPEGLDYDAWVEGQRQGRSFVSTGPIVSLEIGGKKPGDALVMRQAGTILAQVAVQSQYPLERIELIVDGEVVIQRQYESEANTSPYKVEAELPLDRTGWVAARVWGSAPRDYVGRRQVAHTNPIYVEVTGTHRNSASSARFFLAWIDRLENDLKQRDRMRHRQGEVREQLDAARAIYEALSR